MFKQKEEPEKEGIMAFVYPDYTIQELRDFEKEMEVYKTKKAKVRDVEYKFYDELKWYQDNGAIGPNGGVILGDSPVKFEILRNKLWKMYALQGRREYAQKMNREEIKQDVKEFTEVLQTKLDLGSEINPFKV